MQLPIGYPLIASCLHWALCISLLSLFTFPVWYIVFADWVLPGSDLPNMVLLTFFFGHMDFLREVELPDKNVLT